MIDAFDKALKQNTPITHYLTKNKILESSSIADTASRQFGLPRIDLDAIDPLSLAEATKLVSSQLIRKHHMLSLIKKGHLVSLAVADPSDDNAINEIKFNTDTNIDLIIA